MTKVIGTVRARMGWALLAYMAASNSWGQNQPPPKSQSDVRVVGKASLSVSPAENLYLQLSKVGLDRSRVYTVRGLSLDRASLHLTLDEGTIAFTEDVAGRVTGAFFEGDGEVLFAPPNQVERSSMALFTGSAILEERFLTAYFRFNDDTFHEMQPALLPAEHAQEFVTQWNESARTLASGDALRMFMSFSQLLPVADSARATVGDIGVADRFLHVRLQGRRLGVFDLYYDADSIEQIWAGQPKTVEGTTFYDVWSSYSLPQAATASEGLSSTTGEDSKADAVAISHYKIRADVRPPRRVDAEALLQLDVRQGGARTVLFELSRDLQIKSVEADGQPLEFIHNPAIEGTQLARHGNDLVAVVFPRTLRAGQKLDLHFVYGGEVLSEAGAGLLYVGARGTWYPNRGLVMSNFDLEFHYPPGWTLVATGKRQEGLPGVSESTEQVSRWTSERPIPVAGFNLGKYGHVEAHAAGVTVETYATGSVERGFPQPSPDTAGPSSPSPSHNVQRVADLAARAIDFYSSRFGPYPFSTLALTQLPGALSQGWPGLIFLSSYSFLTSEEKSELNMGEVQQTLISQVIAHETAHQWWGDLVTWTGYRDQWLVEALANYSSMMLLESENPAQFHPVMEKYRDDLLEKNQAGSALLEDGPVALGTRLSNSQFPGGYEAISYGRGTWLLHMLRTMLRDAEVKSGGRGAAGNEPFVRGLRRLREHYQGKAISTREFLQVFEEDLPRPLWYEGHRSLDWFSRGWVNGNAVPYFELRGAKYTAKVGSTAVSGTILQKDAPDDLVTVIPVYASLPGKMVLIGQVFADGPETLFHLTAPSGTRKVVLDPNRTLLARTR